MADKDPTSPTLHGEYFIKDALGRRHKVSAWYFSIRGTLPADRNHALYRTPPGILSRGQNPVDPSFNRYGARGIRVCERWRKSFDGFVEDMGSRPEGHTMDRIDNEGHYEPADCRWATHQEQMANRQPRQFWKRPIRL